MSDALAAANMISGDLAFYRMMDGLRSARARSNDSAEIANLQAQIQRLANYGRYVEQQHNSLLAEAKQLDAQRRDQINAQLQELEALRREVADLRWKNADVHNSLEVAGKGSSLLFREHCKLTRRVEELEAENAQLRQISQAG